jgi:type I phosphodiesterase/nucleotide pyrophosphatase
MSGRARRWTVASLTLALGLSGHFHGDTAYLRRMNAPDPDRPAPQAFDASKRRAIAPARRLWVLFADGLGDETAMAQSGLASLARRGIHRALLADFPSFTYPALVTIATGLPPRWSGMRVNAHDRLDDWDSVAKRAAAAGIPVHIVNATLPDFGGLLEAPSDAKVEELDALLADKTEARALAFVYFGEVDDTGHAFGGDSPEYRAAAARADRLALDLFARLDPSLDALVVISDHGHLPHGGHGGEERSAIRASFIAAGGPFASAAELPDAPMRNVAPTLAWALGLDPPARSLGRPMLDAFGLEPGLRDTSSEEDEARARAAFAEDGAVRLTEAALLMAALFAGAIACRRTRAVLLGLTSRDLLPSFAYLAGFFIPYFGAHYTISWSIPRGEGGFYVHTLIFGLIGGALSILVARRSRRTEEALASLLLYGVPYFAVSAYVGLNTQKLADPISSYALILWATVEFYACIILGVRAFRGTTATIASA